MSGWIVAAGALAFSAGFGVTLIVARAAYRRGRLAGFVDGMEYGRKRGFSHGLARGVVITSGVFAGASLQRPILEDLTLGGRLEERLRETAARKPS